MTRPAKREDIPPVNFVEEVLIITLWKQGVDTYDIARNLGLREWQVFNRLLHLREAGR